MTNLDTTTPTGISEHFYKSLSKLNQNEQTQVQRTVFDFLQNPLHPSLKLHRLERLGNGNFWSAYVNMDLRIILYKHQKLGWVFAYVGHHDDAYLWAKNHRMEIHPTTGMLQMYRTIEEEKIVTRPIRPLIGHYEDDYLLDLGVPPSYLKPLRYVETPEQLVELIDGLPQDVQERLMDLASGKPVLPPPKLSTLEELAHHPLSRQQIQFIQNMEELRQALNYPWERWMVFLHPAQREAVERTFQGPARVTGPAGTGKTVVALHRTAALVKKYPESPMLLTTFNKALASRLKRSLGLLLGELPQVVTVDNLHALAHRWYADALGPVKVFTEADYRAWVLEAGSGLGFDADFLLSEFALLDSWGLYTWESYRGFARTGRSAPLSARQRQALFGAFEQVWQQIEAHGGQTFNGLVHRVRQAAEEKRLPRFRAVVVDEAQDFGPAELMLVRALAEEEPDSLFFALDPAQRIYKGPLSWQALGLEVRGRSFRLKVNYRTTREIARFAERILPAQLEEEVREILSLLKGPVPQIQVCKDQKGGLQELVRWVRWLLDQGLNPQEVAVLSRTKYLANETARALELAGLRAVRLSKSGDEGEGVRYGPVHGAKGMEFRAVAVFGANKDLFPLESLLRGATAERDREVLMDQERNLLYVALSRAREHLWVGYWGEPSLFLLSSTAQDL